MSETLCNAPTKDGRRCHFPKSECPWHQEDRPESDELALQSPAAIDGRDLRELGWWTIEHTIRGDLAPNRGSVISTIMRTLVGMGPAPLDEDEILREVELRGILMNGIPPRNDEQWELAAKIFDEEALSEFRRWPARIPEGPGDNWTPPD